MELPLAGHFEQKASHEMPAPEPHAEGTAPYISFGCLLAGRIISHSLSHASPSYTLVLRATHCRVCAIPVILPPLQVASKIPSDSSYEHQGCANPKGSIPARSRSGHEFRTCMLPCLCTPAEEFARCHVTLLWSTCPDITRNICNE